MGRTSKEEKMKMQKEIMFVRVYSEVTDILYILKDKQDKISFDNLEFIYQIVKVINTQLRKLL